MDKAVVLAIIGLLGTVITVLSFVLRSGISMFRKHVANEETLLKELTEVIGKLGLTIQELVHQVWELRDDSAEKRGSIKTPPAGIRIRKDKE